ncbi:MAG: glycerol-3-phosphate 1-O-acyltransferase PlsY [Acidimicrobiia bacterium]|nr:glycerol-3-phosphate 1-O-acyltransferase PlsY [Acidimicrobiia bacterium]NNC74673.1 glycerol-3-phosphate 1-O-acyltransferase PlsY [Acidimicrobiia bacterium]
MPDPVAIALLVAASYLVGGIDFGVIVPRIMGVDIYGKGSGNPGTSNVYRTLGRGPALLVMVGDAAKGLGAAALGSLLISDAVGFACVLAAVVGHILPVWHGFKGGRGVATAIGGLGWLAPWPGLVIAVVWLAIVVVLKIASAASLLAMVLYVPAAIIQGHRGAALIWAGATAVVVVARHSANIRRLVSGAERRIAGEAAG